MPARDGAQGGFVEGRSSALQDRWAFDRSILVHDDGQHHLNRTRQTRGFGSRYCINALSHDRQLRVLRNSGTREESDHHRAGDAERGSGPKA
jgi:hypothetical protein